MTIIRAQVVLKHVSGLPRDNVTNTFWLDPVTDDVPTTAEAQAFAQVVRDFYLVDPAGLAQRPADRIGASIANGGHEVRITPINEATGLDVRGLGFPPVWVETWALPAGRPASIPNEVACCLSFKNTSAGDVPPARRRGRIYFGPLTAACVDTSVDGTPRVAFELRDSLLAAAAEFSSRVGGLAADWIVYSRPYEGRAEVARPGNPRGPLPALPARPGAKYDVQSAWVDNAFDTIRKRGERASARGTTAIV